MKKTKPKKKNLIPKYEKPLKLEMSFDEAIKRLSQVKPQKKK